MPITKKDIEELIRAYLFEKDGYTFLHKEEVENLEKTILSQFCGVYARVEEDGLRRGRFLVGNIKKRIGKPVFEIYIE